LTKPKKLHAKLKDGTYELPKLEDQIDCPACGKGKMKITRTIYTLPDKEEVLILLMECKKCNYENRDVISLKTAFKPGIWTITVHNKDFTFRILRGQNGFISLPEAEFDIEPGPNASYMITTIDGILERMMNWAEYMKSNLESEGIKDDPELKKVLEVLDVLNKCLNGEMDFHIILRDEYGGSYVTTDPGHEQFVEFTPLEEKK
jgi:ZPR1-related zinc finger protein